MPHIHSVVSYTEECTEALGRALGRCISSGDTILIHGELGAGKTCMARGIATGAESEVEARSPTFIMVAEYPGRVRLFHCDLYRVDSEIEAEELALHENLSRGALVVEWPERAAGLLPEDALRVRIDPCSSDNSRHITFSADGIRSERLLNDFLASQSKDKVIDESTRN